MKYYITITKHPECDTYEAHQYFLREFETLEEAKEYIEKSDLKLNQYVQIENEECGDCLNWNGTCFTNIFTEIKESTDNEEK